MQYLGSEYRLNPVDQSVYQRQAAKAGQLKRDHKLEYVMRELIKDSDPFLIDHTFAAAAILHKLYDAGGGFYCLSMCIGIATLCEANPNVALNTDFDWAPMAFRETELRNRPGIGTINELSGIGMLEISAVNDGYVDGYQAAFRSTNLRSWLGFTGLATVNAHDLMHFASSRNV